MLQTAGGMNIKGRVLSTQYHELYHHYHLIHQQRKLQGKRLRFISLITCKIEIHILQITLFMEGQTICRWCIVSSQKVRYVSHLATVLSDHLLCSLRHKSLVVSWHTRNPFCFLVSLKFEVLFFLLLALKSDLIPSPVSWAAISKRLSHFRTKLQLCLVLVSPMKAFHAFSRRRVCRWRKCWKVLSFCG